MTKKKESWFMKYENVRGFAISLSIVFIIFVWFVLKPNLIEQETFNPDLHKCLEAEECNYLKHKTFGGYKCLEEWKPTDINKFFSNYEEEGLRKFYRCSDYLDKTECEKGNPGYIEEEIMMVSLDITSPIRGVTIKDLGCEFNLPGLDIGFDCETKVTIDEKGEWKQELNYYNKTICREITEEEKYCKENPNDEERCECLGKGKTLEKSIKDYKLEFGITRLYNNYKGENDDLCRQGESYCESRRYNLLNFDRLRITDIELINITTDETCILDYEGLRYTTDCEIPLNESEYPEFEWEMFGNENNVFEIKDFWYKYNYYVNIYYVLEEICKEAVPKNLLEKDSAKIKSVKMGEDITY